MEGEPKQEYSKEKIEEIRKKWVAFRLALSEEDFDIVTDKITEKAKELQSRYNAKNYAMYHVLIGSTEDPATITHEDFPKEDSVETFIDNLIAES